VKLFFDFFGSMANRVFLILLAGIIVATTATTYLAARERRLTISEMRNQHAAERVEQLVLALDAAKPEAREQILRATAIFGVEAGLVDALDPGTDNNSGLINLLKTRLGESRRIVASREAGCPARSGPGRRFGPEPRRPEVCQTIFVNLQDGALLRMNLHNPGERGGPRSSSAFAFALAPYSGPYFGLFLLLIGLLAFFVARMTARPIKQLAAAASELGRDIERAPLPETGPPEIRQAATAFNAMQARIRRQIQHRTHMLAAITHDLQTPLTRLRLRIEKVGDVDLRNRLIDDMTVMHSMVREGLELARSMDSAEPMQRLDIDSLLSSVCADATDAGQDVTLEGRAGVLVTAQPGALRRCLTNVIDNAVKYGRTARVTVAHEQHQVTIRIRDDGSGIPEQQLEAVFDPFLRLESSRSRDTGGTGLGLTIARNIAENHHATLSLRNHPGGGLEATLQLPAQ
jgi:signal transduction histidine kinase